MKMSQLKRDASKVHAALHERQDGSVVTRKACSIYAPLRIRDRKLSTIDHELYILANFMIVVDNFYGVSNTLCRIRIDPSSITQTAIDGQDYQVFNFEPGDVVFVSTDVVQQDTLSYFVFDEIGGKANVPAYMDYKTEYIRLFDTSQEFTGVTFASTIAVEHYLLSLLARYKKDPKIYFSQVSDKASGNEVKYVPIRSPSHGATNATSRLLSSHFTDNVIAAVTETNDRPENLERLMRM